MSDLHILPAEFRRWQSAGLPKAAALMEAIGRDYPFTEVTGFNYHLGAVRGPDGSGPSAESVMRPATENASLIYDATAEVGIQQYLSDYAAALGIPYIGIDATPGGWGGRIVRIRPGTDAGCWMCYRLALWHKIIANWEYLIFHIVLGDGMQAARLCAQQVAAPHIQLKECLVGPGLLRLADAKALWDAAENAKLNTLCDAAGTQIELVADEDHLTHQREHRAFGKLRRLPVQAQRSPTSPTSP